MTDTSPAIVIRPSEDKDVEAMLAIYRFHIKRGVEPGAYHEEDTLQSGDLKRRRKNMKSKRLPHLAAELNGTLIGYAYAVPFRKRPAYRFVVKHSIYVRNDRLGRGIGRMLLASLIDACAAGGYRQMIGYIDGANEASFRLHTSFGFHEVGRLPSVGYKFGHWTDSVMMQRSLGLGASALPER